jgi:hypothetical protein
LKGGGDGSMMSLMLSKLSLILMIVMIVTTVVVVVISTSIFSTSLLTNINFAFYYDDLLADAHQASAVSLPISGIEHSKSQERAGDAKTGDANLRIASDFVDPLNHCEFCPRIEYSTGPIGKAGIAYKSDNVLDLTGAKRVVFFARGERGGEIVNFVVAGKNTTTTTPPNMQNLSDIFQNKKFGASTQDVSLANDWKKYQIDLTGIDLKDINLPFGFIAKGKGAEKIVFYLKGVTYDTQPAQNPLPVLQPNQPPVANAGQNQTILVSINPNPLAKHNQV